MRAPGGRARFLAAVAGLWGLCPAPALAFSEDVHAAIAVEALDRLPPAARSRLTPQRATLLQGVAAAEAEAHASRGYGDGPHEHMARIVSAVERLSIAVGTDPTSGVLHRREGDAAWTPFLVHALGGLAVHVSHVSQPYGLDTGARTPAFSASYQAVFEPNRQPRGGAQHPVDVPADVAAFLQETWHRAAARQAAVRQDALRGFPPDSTTARTAPAVLAASADAVARVWLAVIEGATERQPTSAATLRVSLDQIRFGVRAAAWLDVELGLLRLGAAGHLIPLTPGNVDPGFFQMHRRGADCGLYGLALEVDPHAARLRSAARDCREGGATAKLDAGAGAPHAGEAANGAGGGLSSPERTGIRALRHRGGTVYLTNRPGEFSDAFVPLNFEPILRYPAPERPGAPADLEAIVQFYATQYALDSALVKAVIEAESDFDPHVVSRAGARGLMQLMPSTALEMGVEEIFDPAQNVAGGTQYLAKMLELFEGDLTLALAAYNAGPGTVLRYGKVPPYEETRQYVPKVLARAAGYRASQAVVRLRTASAQPDGAFLPDAPVVETGAVVILRNGLTMRGLRAVEVDRGVRLEVETGWILVPARIVERVERASG